MNPTRLHVMLVAHRADRRPAGAMTKMTLKITFSVHIIIGNFRGVWVCGERKRLGGHRFVTLARLVSQSEWDTGQLVLLWGGVVTLDAATCRPTGLP